MPALNKAGKAGSRGEPEKTRAAILKAALEEFSQEGVSGARTDEIARRAGVNKALLYYYFNDKEGLYAAVLDEVFAGLSERVQSALAETHLPPRSRLLGYVQAHFDYIAGAHACREPDHRALWQANLPETGRPDSRRHRLGRLQEHRSRTNSDFSVRHYRVLLHQSTRAASHASRRPVVDGAYCRPKGRSARLLFSRVVRTGAGDARENSLSQ